MMDLDDFKSAWHSNFINETTSENDIRQYLAKFDGTVKRNWLIEIITSIAIVVALVVISLFMLPFNSNNLFLPLGIVIMIFSCSFIAYTLIRARRVTLPKDVNLLTHITIQIERREKEIVLLTSILTWYLLPLFTGVLLTSYGGMIAQKGTYTPDVNLILYWGGCLIFYIGIYFYNQRQVMSQLRPLLRQLYQMRRELES